ncbi:MAG: SHOCT domain-containing protein [Streptomycetaceae bacterium]|nr:SHOCT domain-containing protein [Streptomycetaceae bacterium]
MDYPLLDAFLTMMWFFLWILWFVMLFRVIGDIFRDDSLSGWGKTGWLVFVVILPFLGVFVYVIARGRGMGERDMRQARRSEQEFRAYVKDAAGSRSTTDELARLAELKNHGDITAEDYQRAKDKILAA